MNIQSPTREDLLRSLFSHTTGLGTEIFATQDGEKISIQKYILKFKEWHGDLPADTFGGKPVIDHEGNPLFAELALLQIFKGDGWDGVWVDSYREKYRTGMPGIAEPILLPEEKQKLIDSIREKTRKHGGCWDLFLWKGDVILFVELKRQKKDRMQESQAAWLEKSLEMGVPEACFMVAEWSF